MLSPKDRFHNLVERVFLSKETKEPKGPWFSVITEPFKSILDTNDFDEAKETFNKVPEATQVLIHQEGKPSFVVLGRSPEQLNKTLV